eukprot:1926693-Ditylum_brightwellii.AAC.2
MLSEVMSNCRSGTEHLASQRACAGTSSRSAPRIAPMRQLTHNQHRSPHKNWKESMLHASDKQGRELDPHHKRPRTRETMLPTAQTLKQKNCLLPMFPMSLLRMTHWKNPHSQLLKEVQ